jgi:HK97 family phage portal protein
MKLFSALRKGFYAFRSSLENPQTPLSMPAEWLLDIFNGGRTDAGIRVSEMTAFQVVTFLTCVDLISGSIASLPFHIYERSLLPSGRAVNRVAYEHELYTMLHGEPNDEMSRFVFTKTYCAHFLAWGNGYAEIQRDAGNRVLAMWPRNPAKTQPKRLGQKTTFAPEPWRPFPVTKPEGALVYTTTDGIDEDRSDSDATAAQPERTIMPEDMLHIPGLALDGRIGQSVVWLARNTLGLALASEKFGSKYFANFARPGGILELPSNITPEAREMAKRSWLEAQGGENSNRAAVLPAGFKWTATSHTPEEAQSRDLQSFLRNQICALLHVPAHMAGDVEKSRSNTEQMAQEYVSLALTPWMQAIKQEFKRKLFPNPGIGRKPMNNFHVDFDLHYILRPDAASREKYYATGRQWGFLNTNMILELERLNPIDEDWAEKFWMPVNMTLTETPLDPTHQDGAGKGDAPDDSKSAQEEDKPVEPKTGKDGDPETKAYLLSFSRLFRASIARIQDADPPNLREFQSAFNPVFYSMAELFAREVRGQTTPATDRFITDYIGGLKKRGQRWFEQDVEAIIDAEFERAVRAVRGAVYKDVAEQAALEVSSQEREPIAQ